MPSAYDRIAAQLQSLTEELSRIQRELDRVRRDQVRRSRARRASTSKPRIRR